MLPKQYGLVRDGEVYCTFSEHENDTILIPEGCAKVELPSTFKLGQHRLLNGKIIDNESYVKARNKEAKVSTGMNIKILSSNGNTFDADELSQNRLLRAIKVLEDTNRHTIRWKLSNNAVAICSVEELKEVLSLAVEEFTNIIAS